MGREDIRLRSLVTVVLAVSSVVSGCSLLSVQDSRMPTPAANAAEGLIEPPPMRINGLDGKPTSWCWAGGCADGFVNSPPLLEEVAAPFSIALPDGGRIVSASARGPGLPGNQEQFQVDWTKDSIGDVPDGAVILDVSVFFDQGGDASYSWALGD